MNNKISCHICKCTTDSKRPIFCECNHIYCVQCLYRLIFVNHIKDIQNCEYIKIKCKNCDKNGYLDMNLKDVFELLQEIIREKVQLLDKNKKEQVDKVYVCEAHSEEICKFCKTCQINLCFKCAKSEEHSEHDIVDSEQYAEKFRRFLDTIPLKYKNKDEFVTQFDIIAKTFKEEIEKDYEATCKNIDDLKNNLEKLKKEYGKIIRTHLDRGVLLFKIIKMFYVNFYLDLEYKNKIKDILALKYLKDINYEFTNLELSHNQNMFDELNFIRNKSDSLSKSKDGVLKISCSYSSIPRKFENVGKLIKHKGTINTLIQLQDGRLVTGAKDMSIRFWEEKDGTFINSETINEFTGKVLCLCQIKDGRILSSCLDNNTIRVWNKMDDKYVCELSLSEHKSYVTCIMQIADGRLVTASHDKTICIWEDMNGVFQKQSLLEGHSDGVYALCETVDGRIVSGSNDKTICVWKQMTKPNFVLEQKLTEKEDNGHKLGIRSLCGLNDGRFVSGSEDCTYKVWTYTTLSEEDTNKKWICTFTIKAHYYGVTCMTQLKDGRLVTASKDKSIRIWEEVNGTFYQTEALKEHSNTIYSVIEMADGRLASSGRDNQVMIWKDGNWRE